MMRTTRIGLFLVLLAMPAAAILGAEAESEP